MIKAIPVSDGSASKSALEALRAPAEPPMPTMKLGFNASHDLRQIAGFPENTFAFLNYCFPSNAFTNPHFLIGACGSIRIHRY
jgi:hypothetical protein